MWKKCKWFFRKVLPPVTLVIVLVVLIVEVVNLNQKLQNQNWRLFDLEGSSDGSPYTLESRVDFIGYSIDSLLRSAIVDAVNQYRLDDDSTCEEITMRLGGYYSAFSLVQNDLPGLENTAFKRYIDGLIEANEDNDASIRTWEHVEYCLLNQ